jgi:hypothetical protein
MAAAAVILFSIVCGLVTAVTEPNAGRTNAGGGDGQLQPPHPTVGVGRLNAAARRQSPTTTTTTTTTTMKAFGGWSAMAYKRSLYT